MPSGESLMIPISIGAFGSAFPPWNTLWNAPGDTGKEPPSKTIPPPKKLPSGPYVAVNPQLLALLPESEQKISVGSITSVDEGSYPLTSNLTTLSFTTYLQETSVLPFAPD